MYKIEKGEYECPRCKRFTTIVRTQKTEFPLTCCKVEMLPKAKTKFTEPPPPRHISGTQGSTARKTRSSRAISSKSGQGRKKTATAVAAQATLPLSPGPYRCPTCGYKKELGLSDQRDQHLRCPECFVKMQLQT